MVEQMKNRGNRNDCSQKRDKDDRIQSSLDASRFDSQFQAELVFGHGKSLHNMVTKSLIGTMKAQDKIRLKDQGKKSA